MTWGSGGSGYKLQGPSSLEGGLGSEYIAYSFVFLGSIITFEYTYLQFYGKPKSLSSPAPITNSVL